MYVPQLALMIPLSVIGQCSADDQPQLAAAGATGRLITAATRTWIDCRAYPSRRWLPQSMRRLPRHSFGRWCFRTRPRQDHCLPLLTAVLHPLRANAPAQTNRPLSPNRAFASAVKPSPHRAPPSPRFFHLTKASVPPDISKARLRFASPMWRLLGRCAATSNFQADAFVSEPFRTASKPSLS
jgi:hypothetical protein